MADFARTRLDSQTVGEMYDSTKVKLLKVYMVTKSKTTDADIPSLPAKKKARIPFNFLRPSHTLSRSLYLSNLTMIGRVFALLISVIQLWISLKEFQISLIQLLISVIR